MFLQKRHVYWIAGLAAAVIVYFAWVYTADAADLGGNCCADLEERISELEATAAKKGNRKVSLTVYGQVSKGILFLDDGEEDDAFVRENSAAESFVGFRGEAKIDKDWSAGFLIEIGVGGFDERGEYGFGFGGSDTNDLYTRHAVLYVAGPIGKVSLGHTSQSTDSIAEITVANTAVAARMLSLRPLNGPQFGEVLDIFDGTRGNLVRYDTVVMGGFQGSASWSGTAGDEDVWDAALRFGGEFGGFRVAAGAGYRDGVLIPGLVIPSVDVQVLSGSASVKHVATGLFVSGAAGRVSPGSGTDLTGWHVQGGFENNVTKLGNTTIFGEFATLEIDGSDASPQLYGGGVVQSFDNAAFDLFINLRILDPDSGDESDDVTTGMVGGRIRF